MKVILREDVSNLGTAGTIVSVADGYARNYLIPRNVAIPATGNNLAQFEHERRMMEAKRAKRRKEAGMPTAVKPGCPVAGKGPP